MGEKCDANCVASHFNWISTQFLGQKGDNGFFQLGERRA